MFEKVRLILLKLAVSLIIVAFNFILRKAIIWLVVWTGRKTISLQMATILKFLFVSQFFNTAFLLLLVHTNLENSHVPFIKRVFNGEHPDFTMEWYFKVGAYFSQTLVILGFAPAIEACMAIVYLKINQKLDIGYFFEPKEPCKTRAKTVQQFVDLYSGPEMLYHYRYAYLMISIFTTMVYGVGMPILFPITLFNLCIQYAVDRILTVYLY